ncbi:MAG TPA: peptide MFS transporter [Steroidobacteraceae bacterium]|nr:peptide MFS transporter [Steroidobacteraceae bacterium]
MPPTTSSGATFFGHPRGLATLFFTEFFERFSYYGMRALLVLFLTATVANGGLGVDSETAGAIYGLYAGSVYLFSMPGGWVADRLLGQRRSIWYGGILISLGNFMLAIPSLQMFYLGLITIVLGTGLLKPNISAIVGELYRHQSGARRDAGFSIFYMGINLGATIAPLVSGTVGETVGYRWGFFTAGAAMLIGLLQYRLTGHYLGDAGLTPQGTTPAERRRSAWWLLAGLALLAVAILAVGSGAVSLDAGQLADALGKFMALLAVVFFGSVFLFGGLDATEKKRVAVIVVFFLCACLFWAGFEQAATTLNLFARDLTDRSLLGSFFEAHEHPASWYQSVNPVYIIVLSPFFAWLWVALGRRNLDPSAPLKFGVGLILLGLGFAVLILAAELIIAHGGRVGPQWLLMTYFLHTSGELCLSPIGLSNVTKLAPPRFVSQMMGTWFLGAAVGNLAAGRIGGHIGSDAATMPTEFLHMTIVGAGAGLLMLMLSPLLRRWMGGIR